MQLANANMLLDDACDEEDRGGDVGDDEEVHQYYILFISFLIVCFFILITISYCQTINSASVQSRDTAVRSWIEERDAGRLRISSSLFLSYLTLSSPVVRDSSTQQTVSGSAPVEVHQCCSRDPPPITTSSTSSFSDDSNRRYASRILNVNPASMPPSQAAWLSRNQDVKNRVYEAIPEEKSNASSEDETEEPVPPQLPPKGVWVLRDKVKKINSVVHTKAKAPSTVLPNQQEDIPLTETRNNEKIYAYGDNYDGEEDTKKDITQNYKRDKIEDNIIPMSSDHSISTTEQSKSSKSSPYVNGSLSGDNLGDVSSLSPTSSTRKRLENDGNDCSVVSSNSSKKRESVESNGSSNASSKNIEVCEH